jgi:hypothetical protein
MDHLLRFFLFFRVSFACREKKSECMFEKMLGNKNEMSYDNTIKSKGM